MSNGQHGNIYRKPADVDIVIVGCEKADLTWRCIWSINAYTPAPSYRVTYIDNGSKKLDFELFTQTFPHLQIVRLPFNHGYVRGANIGLALALLSGSKYVLLLNNDTEIVRDDVTWLERFVSYAEEMPDIGAVGAVSDRVFGYQRREKAGDDGEGAIVPALVGFALLIKKAALARAGLMDERYEPGNFDDFDYSFKLLDAGYRLMVAESVWIHHHMHASTPSEQLQELLNVNQAKFVQKWGYARAHAAGLA